MNGKFVNKDQNGNFVTGYRNGDYDRDGGQEKGYDVLDYKIPDSSPQLITGSQWHPRTMEQGNVNVEDWADIFQNWIFTSYAKNNAGYAIND